MGRCLPEHPLGPSGNAGPADTPRCPNLSQGTSRRIPRKEGEIPRGYPPISKTRWGDTLGVHGLRGELKSLIVVQFQHTWGRYPKQARGYPWLPLAITVMVPAGYFALIHVFYSIIRLVVQMFDGSVQRLVDKCLRTFRHT